MTDSVFISAEKIKQSMSRTNSAEETNIQGQESQDVKDSRKRSHSLVTELLYIDNEGSNPDVTLSPASSLTRVELLRMGSCGDILGQGISDY